MLLLLRRLWRGGSRVLLQGCRELHVWLVGQ